MKAINVRDRARARNHNRTSAAIPHATTILTAENAERRRDSKLRIKLMVTDGVSYQLTGHLFFFTAVLNSSESVTCMYNE